MSIRLKYREDFSNGLNRLAVRETKKAKKSLENARGQEELHEAIHTTRKAFKKIRATLRLVRDSISDYKVWNAFFRDEARKVSAVRDATAHLETLELLENQYKKGLRKNVFKGFRNSLHAYRSREARKAFVENRHQMTILKALERKMEELRHWTPGVQEFQQIRPSLKRVYKRGRKGFRKAQRRGKTEDFHEWRKRAKYLRYQLDILHRVWPAFMKTFENELHELTDLTGTAHDLVNLKRTLEKESPQLMQKPRGQLLISLIDHQRELLKKQALLLGAKLYQPEPASFSDHIGRSWKSHGRSLRATAFPQLDQLLY